MHRANGVSTRTTIFPNHRARGAHVWEELVEHRIDAVRDLLEGECAVIGAREAAANVENLHIEAPRNAHVKDGAGLLQRISVRGEVETAAADVEAGRMSQRKPLSRMP